MSQNEIYKLMPKVMAAIGAVEKDKKNDHNKYGYRSVEATMEACQKAFIEHGVTLVPRIESAVEVGGMMVVTYSIEFFAPDSSSVKPTVAIIGKPSHTGFQNGGAIYSYAFKEIMFKTFSIPVEQEDVDAHPSAPMAAPKPSAATKPPPRASKQASGAAKPTAAPVATASGQIPRGAILKETDEELMTYSADELLALFDKATASGQTTYAERIKAVGVKVREHEARAAAKLPM